MVYNRTLFGFWLPQKPAQRRILPTFIKSEPTQNVSFIDNAEVNALLKGLTRTCTSVYTFVIYELKLFVHISITDFMLILRITAQGLHGCIFRSCSW
jgi:hypothetical protein